MRATVLRSLRVKNAPVGVADPPLPPLGLLLEAIEQGILVVDGNGTLLIANIEARRLLSLPAMDVPSELPPTRYAPNDEALPSLADGLPLLQLFETGQGFTAVQFLSPAGRYLLASARAAGCRWRSTSPRSSATCPISSTP